MRTSVSFGLVLALSASACSSSSGGAAPADDAAADAPFDVDAAIDAGGAGDAGDAGDAADASPDVDAEAAVDKAANCATTAQLGTLLSAGHGRADGLVRAIVPTNLQTCTASANSSHMTLEITIQGKIERLVVRTIDTVTAPGTMWFATKQAPLVGGPWSEGWHTGAAYGLDYVASLGVHASDFAPYVSADLVAAVSAPIGIGDAVSIYATSDFSGSALDGTRAHLVHRYAAGGANADGAIVIHPKDASPTWMLFYYASEKSF